MATKIEIELLTEIKDAIKGLNQFQSEATKTFKEVEKSVEGTNKQIASFGTNIKSALAVAGGFVLAKVFQEAASIIKSAASEAVDAAIEQEEAINRLNVALATNGRFSEAASKDLQAFASSLQQTTNVADEAILNVAALIEAMTGLEKEGLKGATQATIDFATTFRLDLDSAARVVGKALQGNVDALKRYGIEVKKGTTEAETFANVLDALGRASAGSAEAATRTFSGSLAGLNVQINETLETIGNLIIGNDAVKSGIQTAANAFRSLDAAIKEAGPSLERIVTFLSEIGGNLAFGIINIVKSFVEFTDVIVNLSSQTDGIIDAFTYFGLILRKYVLTSAASVLEVIQNLIDLIEKIPGVKIDIETDQALKDVNKLLDDNYEQIQLIEQSTKDLGRVEKDRAKEASSGLKNQQRELQELQKEIKKTEGAFGAAFKKAIVSIQFVADDSGEAAGKKTGKQFGGSFLTTFIDAFLPGFGKFITDIVGALSGKSQDAATEFIEGFRRGFFSGIEDLGLAIIRGLIGTISSKAASDSVKADIIGSLVEEVIAAIPAFFEAIAESIVQILSEGTLGFKIAVAVVRGIIRGFERVGPEGFEGIGTRVIKGLYEAISNIDWSVLINGLLNAFGPLFQAVLGFVNQIVDVIRGGPIEAFKASIANAGRILQTSIIQAGQGFAASVLAGADGFIQKIIEGVQNALPVGGSAPSIPGVSSGGDGGLQLPKLPFFADGGRVPDMAQFKNDGLVARVSAGEQILSEDLSSKLDQFLQGSQAPQPVTVNLRLGESEIAKVLLNLNRQGFRTV